MFRQMQELELLRRPNVATQNTLEIRAGRTDVSDAETPKMIREPERIDSWATIHDFVVD
jgi:hypothetical protein